MTFYFEKDKNNILVDNILFILLEEIFRQLILQRIRIKDSLRIFKDKDKDFWAIWEVYAELNVEFWIYSSIFAFLKTYCIFFHNCWAFWHLLQSFEPFLGGHHLNWWLWCGCASVRMCWCSDVRMFVPNVVPRYKSTTFVQILTLFYVCWTSGHYIRGRTVHKRGDGQYIRGGTDSI